MKNKKILIGLLVIVVFSGFAVYSFRDALNPYVTFEEAAAASGTVQVIGYLTGDEEVAFDPESKQFHFYLEDDTGTRALVAYGGTIPTNLDHAENIVVVGGFEGDTFLAQRLLVKCPSKYEDKAKGEEE